MNNNSLSIFIRYGIARKKAFLYDIKDAYDGLAIPGNILLYQFRSTPPLILRCANPFYVDPMTYLFGQPYEAFKRRTKKGIDYKPSFVKLMAGHGLDQEFKNIRYEELLKKIMKCSTLFTNFVNNALEFQQNNIKDVLNNNKELVPEELVDRLDDSTLIPNFLLAPYFLFSKASNDNKLTDELNFRILEYCWQNRNNWNQIYPVLFISKEHLINDSYKKIGQRYIDNAFPGYCIWIDDFVEKDTNKDIIKNLIDLIKILKSHNAQLFILRGGFFSLLLHKFGVNAICHGLAYGESQSALAMTRRKSGSPPVRYYLRDLHTFLTLEDSLKILRKNKELICTCPVCRRVVRNDPERVINYEKQEDLAEMHFLWNRNYEKKIVLNSELEELLQYLEMSSTIYRDISDITKQYRRDDITREKSIIIPEYLNTWKEAISEVL